MKPEYHDKKDCQQLSKTFLFQNIDEVWIQYAIKQGELVCFQKGEIIYSQNQYRKSIGILLQGKASVLKGQTENKSILFNTFLPGDIFGGAALFHEETEFIAEIYARQHCRILFLKQELLSELFHKEVQIAENYICFLSHALLYLNKKIDGYTAGSAERTLACYLLGQTWENAEFELPYNLSKLAKYLNLSRASLYRGIQCLIEKGVIEKEKNKIKLLNKEGLNALQKKNT